MDKLKFIAVSGTTRVTQNLYIYEFLPQRKASEIIVVDCGVGFPEETTYGVDLVIPDFSYLLSNKEKVAGIFISHGHEDHYGALPFLARELNVPIFATRLTAGFIEEKLADYGVRGGKIRLIDPRDSVSLGNFRVEAFRVTHSVPDSVGFCITTPVGKIFHVSDYKFDWTPVDQLPFDIAGAAELAQDGVLALASDCLGATSDGYTKSELEIEKTIELIMEEAKGRVFFTTISSNISRMRQAINSSERLGRKVVLVGRSIERKMEIAKELKLFDWPDKVVIPLKEAEKIPPNQLTYIISGCYGQIGSALYRVALGEHKFLKIEAGDVVIFSADPTPPGTEQTVNYVVDNLIKGGAQVHYYDTQEDLHVSGHGSQKEIEMLLSLVKARYLIPIGGTVRHMRSYRTIAQNMGWRAGEVFELRPGGVVEFTKDRAIEAKAIPVRDVLVDGLGIGDVGNIVLRDRKTLAREGIVVAVVQLDQSSGKLISTPEVISRGFVFQKEQQGFLRTAGGKLAAHLKSRLKLGNGKLARKLTVEYLEHFFWDKLRRRPMILPMVIEV